MRSRIQRYWYFRKSLTGAFVMLGLLRIALAVLPYRKVRQFTSASVARYPERHMHLIAYESEMVWAIERVGRLLVGKRPCLPQALALQWFLRRKGIVTNLHIGVKKDDAKGIAAHAWLEKNGRVLIGGSDSPVDFERLETVKS